MSKFRRYLRLPGGERREVDDELAYHIEMKTEQLMKTGLTAEEARAESLLQFGDPDRIRGEVTALVRDRTQRERRASLIDALRQDVRFALRQLRATPGFALVAILTIALGISATTAIFSVVRAVLLRPLPYDGADRIVFIGEADSPTDPDVQNTTSYHNFEDFRARTKSWEALGLFNGWAPTVTGAGEPERLLGSMVTHEIFDVFRVRPVLGRPMKPTDNLPNQPRIVWISWQLWQTRFGADPKVIGKTITLSGFAREIVGVLPRDLPVPGAELSNQVWAPNYRDSTETRTSRYLNVVGRLQPGVTLDAARTELAGVMKQLQAEYPADMKGQYAVLYPLRDFVIGGRTRAPILMLMLASAVVLLIACANTSNLLIARGSYRSREFAIRAALGTTRGRVIRQLLTESVVLAGLGAAAGIGLAFIALRWLVTLAPEAIQTQQVSIDRAVLGFALLLSVGSAMLFGLLPALRATKGDVQKALRDEGRGSTSGQSRRLRGSLAVVQLSLALSLVLGAGLLIKSFARMLQIDSGIQPANLITFGMVLPTSKYDVNKLAPFFEDLQARLEATPGVIDASVSSIVPFGGSWDRVTVDTGSAPARTADIDLPEGDRYIVSTSYFRTMGIHVLQGRTFTAADRADAPPVAVVDPVFARKVARNGNALGVRIGVPGRDTAATIVGIVNHVKHYGLDAESGGQIYISHEQYPNRYMDVIVRAERDPLKLSAALRAVVHSMDPERPVQTPTTMDALMAQRTAVRRFVLALLTAFAAIALILASIGLYGVIAYTIAQRRREFGIRLAVGATPRELVSMVVREGAALVAIGVACGILLAALGTRLIGSLLFGVRPLDPTVILGAAALLSATAGLAAWLPARRAARADPLESLRG